MEIQVKESEGFFIIYRLRDFWESTALIRYRLWPMVMSGIIFYLLYQFAYNPHAHSILGLFIVSWIPLWWHMVNHFIRAWKYRGEPGTAEKLIRYQTVRDFPGIHLFFLAIGWILKIVSGVFLGVIGMVYTVIQFVIAIVRFFAKGEGQSERKVLYMNSKRSKKTIIDGLF